MSSSLPVFLAIFLSVGACLAQNSVDAGLYYVYDYKLEPAMTPAPKGYKPFYISHYGRHGARYCEREFDSLAVWLEKAATAGVLTEKGIHFPTKKQDIAKVLSRSWERINTGRSPDICSIVFPKYLKDRQRSELSRPRFRGWWPA